MPNYLTEGNKSITCKCKHICIIPLQTTIYKCPSCGMTLCAPYFGTIVDKNGNNIF